MNLNALSEKQLEDLIEQFHDTVAYRKLSPNRGESVGDYIKRYTKIRDAYFKKHSYQIQNNLTESF